MARITPPASGGTGTSVQVVEHGATAGTSRPVTTAPVLWIGSVEPDNAEENDQYLDPSAPSLAVHNGTEFVALGGGGGGGSVGSPCWFEGSYPDGIDAATGAQTSWAVIDDGVAAGTDVIVAVDPEFLEVVTGGTYLVTLAPGKITGTDGLTVSSYPVLNDDSVGPAYYLTGEGRVGDYVTMPTFPLILAPGDTLALKVTLPGATTDGSSAFSASAILLRIA